jgi:hypothetical protein
MDGSNLSLGLASPLTTQGPFGGAIFDNAIGNTTFGLNTSLAAEIVITQGANAVTGVNSTLRITSGAVAAPEGGSAITLLAAALVAMELLRRRSRPQIS